MHEPPVTPRFRAQRGAKSAAPREYQGRGGTLPLCSLLVALIAMGAAGCAKKGRVQTPRMPRTGHTETGIASWYGDPYHGRRAANGEVYDMHKLTAAHRTLPFDTLVQVTHLGNGRHVDVRITDRGPFADRRIIDLSLAAAEQIDMVRTGTAKVRLKVMGRAPAAAHFTVQAGAFRERENAERLRHRLGRRYGDTELTHDDASGLWRVTVGGLQSREQAERVVRALGDGGIHAVVISAGRETP